MFHFFRSKPFLTALIACTFAAGVVRFFALGSIPHGITWDEAAIGYNGWSVVTTYRDEWLQRLPISFRSFDDYKAPAAIYIVGVFTTFLGLEPWVIRLPFALAGTFTVPLFMFWVYRISPMKVRLSAAVSAGLFLAFSPWHMHFTRAGFESGLSVFFVMLGLVVFDLIHSTKGKKSYGLATASALSFAASLYTYHSPKLVVPLFGFILLWWYKDSLKKIWKELVVAGTVGITSLIPLVYDSFTGGGLSRGKVFFFSEVSSFTEGFMVLTSNILAHLTPGYLFMGEAVTYRHAPGHWGILLWTTGVAIIWGIGILVRDKNLRKEYSKLLKLASLLILAGMMPAFLSITVPHQNRSLLAILGVGLLVAAAVSAIWNHSQKKQKSFVLITAICLHILMVTVFLHSYFTQFASLATADFQDGYLDAMHIVNEYESGVYGPVPEKIRFDDTYGQPYIYALFSKQANPYQYHWYGALHNYEFVSDINIGDLMRDNALIVSTYREDMPQGEVDHFVYGADGSIRFMIFRTEDRE